MTERSAEGWNFFDDYLREWHASVQPADDDGPTTRAIKEILARGLPLAPDLETNDGAS